MMFGTWDVGSLCTVGSLKTVASILTKSKLNLVAVQDVRWNKVGSEPADYKFIC
jgi:hypothetical protein